MSVLNLHRTLTSAKDCRNQLTEIKQNVLDKTKNIDELKTKLENHDASLNDLIKNIEEFKNGYVTKQELEIISDEISQAMEDFIVNQQTPRNNNEDLLKMIQNLQEQLNNLNPPIRQSEDIDSVVQHKIPPFKRPIKKLLK